MFKKICFFTANRSDYSKVRTFIGEINSDSYFDLTTIVGGTHFNSRYGNSVGDLIDDGISVDYKVDCLMDNDSVFSMTKTSALQIYEITNILERNDFDLGVVVGDRYDILPAAYAFSLCNIPVAHIQGGEKTGTIDDMIRDTITSLSHIHFVANNKARSRLISLGEDDSHVFVSGCPSIDYIKNANIPKDIDMNILSEYCKDPIDLSKSDDYFLVIVHPNVTEPDDISIDDIISAVDEFPNKKVFFYPNSDPFHQPIVNAIFKRKDFIKFKHLSTLCFLMILSNCKCLIGNSSAGIRESCLFGVPTINIGNRQRGRDSGENVVDCSCKKEDIVLSIKSITNDRFKSCSLYGDGNSAEKMIKTLKSYRFLEYKNILLSKK